MFQRIVAPLDGAPEVEVIVPFVSLVARSFGAAVTLVRVVEGGRHDHGQNHPGGNDGNDHAAAARAYLAGHAAALERLGIAVECVVLHGKAAEEIVAEASRRKADLIVMATHGRSGLGRAMMGSVSERVLAHSPVPVMFFRPGTPVPTKLKKLLVPVDGGPGGSLALQTAIDLARSLGAAIVLLEVAVPIPPLAYMLPDGASAYIDPRWDEDARLGAQAYVDRLATGLRAEGIAVEARAVLGSVVDSISDEASDQSVDLIVMNTHALTGPSRALLGSVADAVVRTSARPVLLLRYGLSKRGTA